MSSVPETPTARTAFAREDWIAGATELLAEKGPEGLRVEVLAKQLGVTKGSFYWHFKDRRDLMLGVLETWRAGRLRDIEKQTRAKPGQEVAQLAHLIEVYSAARNRKGMLIELAIRDWARRDADVANVVEEVEAYRIECTRQLFLARGVNELEAKARSVLLYAYVFGQSLMFRERFEAQSPEMRNWLAERITDA